MKALIPFREALKMTKAAIEEAMIPIRVSQAKKQGEMELLNLDEKLLKLEIEIRELTVKHPIPYDSLIDKLDEFSLLERRQEQFKQIITELFEEVPF
jgi:hypothetical protein